MAYVKFSALVSTMKGKLNGSYFQAQKGSTALKNIGATKRKATATQATWQTAQSRLGFYARQWKTIGISNIAAWDAYALGYERTNKNGEIYTPTGYQMFNECNNNRILMGNTPLTEPVAPDVPYDINDASIEWVTGTNLTFDSETALSPSQKVAIYGWPAQGFGNKYPRGNARLITIVDNDTELPLVFNGLYSNVFGFVPDDASYQFRMVALDVPSGQRCGSKLTKADAG